MEDVVLVFGAVTIAWASVQMGLVQILKGISISGSKLLDTEAKIWLVNGVLAALGMTIAGLQEGYSLPVAAIQALLVFFSASGEHNFLDATKRAADQAGKGSRSDPTPTGTTLPGSGGS